MAMKASEAPGQDPAAQVVTELALDIGRHRILSDRLFPAERKIQTT
jgi:hypothetical protein